MPRAATCLVNEAQRLLYPCGPVQISKKLIDINLVNTCSMPDFLKVGDLAIAALQAEAGKYLNCLRIAAHYFTNRHLFRDHVSSLLQGRGDRISPPLHVMLPGGP